ncbi:hypothetical protein UY3_17167 [Chelonia mydas]|uniref:Uncharacterized protein n=1 Tax=Chelonia mydas TaxID=8469 RepID=M7AKT4_CHEMY|nr:hypothetical protein UY3_17167 [Chelonia mydas]
MSKVLLLGLSLLLCGALAQGLICRVCKFQVGALCFHSRSPCTPEKGQVCETTKAYIGKVLLFSKYGCSQTRQICNMTEQKDAIFEDEFVLEEISLVRVTWEAREGLLRQGGFRPGPSAACLRAAMVPPPLTAQSEAEWPPFELESEGPLHSLWQAEPNPTQHRKSQDGTESIKPEPQSSVGAGPPEGADISSKEQRSLQGPGRAPEWSCALQSEEMDE